MKKNLILTTVAAFMFVAITTNTNGENMFDSYLPNNAGIITMKNIMDKQSVDYIIEYTHIDEGYVQGYKGYLQSEYEFFIFFENETGLYLVDTISINDYDSVSDIKETNYIKKAKNLNKELIVSYPIQTENKTAFNNPDFHVENKIIYHENGELVVKQTYLNENDTLSFYISLKKDKDYDAFYGNNFHYTKK